MSTNEYRYVLELYREDDTPLGQASVTIDWGPAEEWAKFQAMRRGLIAPDKPAHVSSIEPIWMLKAGEPYIDGIRRNISGKAGSCCANRADLDAKCRRTIYRRLSCERRPARR